MLLANFGPKSCFLVSLITTRELTSGSTFWSRLHLCMAVVHLPIHFGADIFIQYGVIDIIPKFKIGCF